MKQVKKFIRKYPQKPLYPNYYKQITNNCVNIQEEYKRYYNVGKNITTHRKHNTLKIVSKIAPLVLCIETLETPMIDISELALGPEETP